MFVLLPKKKCEKELLQAGNWSAHEFSQERVKERKHIKNKDPWCNSGFPVFVLKLMLTREIQFHLEVNLALIFTNFFNPYGCESETGFSRDQNPWLPHILKTQLSSLKENLPQPYISWSIHWIWLYLMASTEAGVGIRICPKGLRRVNLSPKKFFLFHR